MMRSNELGDVLRTFFVLEEVDGYSEMIGSDVGRALVFLMGGCSRAGQHGCVCKAV